MILFNIDLREVDLVYSFYRIDTVDAESENNATVLFFKCAPIASKATCTTLSSLNVMCLVASFADHNPETIVFAETVLKCAPKPKSLASVNNNSLGSLGSHETLHMEAYNYVQKYFKAR
jgi:hypothetical protein